MAGPKLESGEIVATLERLGKRIEERFPGAGLGALCAQLLAVGCQAQARSRAIARPNVPLRLAVGALLLLMAAGVLATAASVELPRHGMDLAQLVQVVEAGINDVVLLGAAAFFLITVEARLKRRRSLHALHELRAIAHIIDMHQLTKDPERIHSDAQATPTSPIRCLTLADLGRYLDYCSEMLSLTGKLAALYGEAFEDPVALAAANELEALTTGLSRKIWQKLALLHAHRR